MHAKSLIPPVLPIVVARETCLQCVGRIVALTLSFASQKSARQWVARTPRDLVLAQIRRARRMVGRGPEEVSISGIAPPQRWAQEHRASEERDDKEMARPYCGM